MNKAIYIWVASLALLYSLCAWAQWHGTAWTERRGRTATTVTNLQAFLVTDTWTRTSTTNFIPEMEISNDFPNSFIDYSVLPSSTNSEQTLTNVFYLDIRKQDPSGFPSYWTNDTWLAKYGKVTNSTNIEYTTENTVISNGVTNIVTNVLYKVNLGFDRSYHVYYGTNAATQINLNMTYDTQRQLDLYFATDERRIGPVSIYTGNTMLFYFDRYDNLSALKNTLGYLLPDYLGSLLYPENSYIIPKSNYSLWFENIRTNNPITHQDWYEWRDTDGDDTNDTWVGTKPTHFPRWTEATFCMSNNLPIQFVTNTVTNTYVDGWKYGAMQTQDSGTNEVSYDVIAWTNSYFDYTPPKNYFGTANAIYQPHVQTNTWTFTWDGLIEIYEDWLGFYPVHYGETNSWDVGTSSMTDWPQWEFELYLCADTNTNAVVNSLYIRLDENTYTNTYYESTWTNNQTNVVSVVLTNANIAAGYDITDYDIDDLPAAINTLKWREQYSKSQDGDTTIHSWADKQTKSGSFEWLSERWWFPDEEWDYYWGPPNCFSTTWATVVSTAQVYLAEGATNSSSMEMWSDGFSYYESYDSGDSSVQDRSWQPGYKTARGKYYIENTMRASADAEIWMAGRAAVEVSTNDTAVYDDFGMGIATNYTVYWTTDINSLQIATSSWVQTSSGITDLPTWTADPDPHADVPYDYNNDNGFHFSKGTWRGIIFEQPLVLMKYDVTDGFEYVE